MNTVRGALLLGFLASCATEKTQLEAGDVQAILEEVIGNVVFELGPWRKDDHVVVPVQFEGYSGIPPESVLGVPVARVADYRDDTRPKSMTALFRVVEVRPDLVRVIVATRRQVSVSFADVWLARDANGWRWRDDMPVSAAQYL